MDVADRRTRDRPTAGTSGPTPRSRSDDGPPSSCVRVWSCTRGKTRDRRPGRGAPGARGPGRSRVWIDLVDPSPERVERIADKLGLHPLIAEDILERNQRAKVEEIDGDLHIVIFDLHFDGEVKLTEVDIVLGERFLLTSHAAAFEPLALAQLRAARAAPRPRPRLPAVRDLDGIVDGYFPVARRAVRGPRLARGRGHREPTSWTLSACSR